MLSSRVLGEALDQKCLNKAEQEKLWYYFTQYYWLCKHILALSAEDLKVFDTTTKSITSLNKDGNAVERQFTMPAKFIQSVYSSLKKNIASIAAKRNKTGKKNGNLMFRSSYDSIDLNQYADTHLVCYGKIPLPFILRG